ncbi:hypothetical protein GCM10022384_42970 [Streptomyces marokkonensis]|uniref:Uncharacterized protein n=1 Tax=Streptomyces marokkonensis TaxID=324855 RepID=A0ABP7QZR5_9ACTN
MAQVTAHATAHDLIAGEPQTAPAVAGGSPTKRLRRGKAASPWQERSTSADSPLAPVPRRRFPASRRGAGPPAPVRTRPRVYVDARTAYTVSGPPAAPGCWDGPMAGAASRTSPVTAGEQAPRHVSTRRRHL